MRLKKYPSLRHEAASLQAIRISHFVVPERQMSWNNTSAPRTRYWQRLMYAWPRLEPYCLVGAEIEKFFLFNPSDLGRWVGGGPFAVPIDGCRRSYLLPAAFVLTACGGIEVDSYLRDYLSNSIVDDAEFEAMSWMGFRPNDHDLYEHSAEGLPGKLESAFRRCGGKPTSRHVALVLFQCRVPKRLDKIEAVFEHLDDLPVEDSPNRVSWRPAIVGLLKGNVDAFAVLERDARDRPGNDDALGEFDELALHLESQQTGTKFWDGIRPVALYGGKKAEWVGENWDLLDPLPQRTPLDLAAIDPPELDAPAPSTGPAPAENQPSAPRPLAS